MKTLLKNGAIIDGSGSASYTGSVILEDKNILEIVTGETSGNFGGEIIDCTGKVIASGFIDAHSHNNWFASRVNAVHYFKPFAEQGITSQ